MKQSPIINNLIRILLLITVSIGLGWSLAIGQPMYVSLFLIALLAILVANLVRYQIGIFDKISYFFESIKNEDFSHTFPDKSGDNIIRKLNHSLNSVNKQIQKIKIEQRQQEQYFQALIEHVGTGILTYDEKGFVLHANSSLKKMLELEHLSHLQQLDKIDLKFANTIRKIQQNEQKLIPISRKKGMINLSVRATTLKSNNNNLTLLSVQDINQELDEKELDSWLKLIRVLTHEIMNAIAPVTSLSESLGNYFQKDGVPILPHEITERTINTTIRGLEVIKEQGKGLIAFVESYRQLSRLPLPVKTKVEVKAFLKKIVLLDRAEYDKSHIQLNIADKMIEGFILADERLISQVLLNLVKNAREALSKKADGKIELFARRNKEKQFEITVRDNGPGITKEIFNEIFVPFFTTRENGSGIGLSLSRQIMRLHGGTLKAHSEPNIETCFTLIFR